MHNPLTRDFDRKLARLDRLAGLVEDTLVTLAADLDARIAAEAQDFPEEHRQDFYEFHAEDHHELSTELPTILRYSVLTGADTACEVYLNNTCETYAEVEGATIGLTDLHGRGIERARDYLKKVARIPFPDNQPEWTTVRRLHDLRNAIVHADGLVPPSRKDLLQWSASIPGLRITESGVIAFGREFTGAALAAYQAFAERVDEACEELKLWRSVFPPLPV